MNTAEVRDIGAIRQRLRAAASVLAWFEDDWLDTAIADTSEDADDAFGEFLVDDCVQIPVGDAGQFKWALNDDVRRRTLRRLGADGVRGAIDEAPQRPDTPVQVAFDRIARGEPDPVAPAPGSPGADDQLAAQLQAIRWLDGVIDEAPDLTDTKRRLALDELLRPMHGLVDQGFYGRADWLERLRAHLSDGRGPLVISGVGGVGKSTLIARFVLDAMASSPSLRFAYLNFDRGTLQPDQPARLLAEILRQVAAQDPSIASPTDGLVRDLSAQETVDAESSGLSSRDSVTVIGTRLSAHLLELAVRILDNACPDRLLLVLDTFEEVQRQRLTNIDVLWQFIADLGTHLPQTRVVISGRALDVGLNAPPGIEAGVLDELDRDAAIGMLMEAQGLTISADQAQHVVDLVTANPLSLRLAIDVLDDGDTDYTLLDLELQEGQIQGQLYRRILLHIDDPEVRRLAHPGLVLRVITADVVQHVLARPCDITVRDAADAKRLRDGLAREATLVVDDGLVLRHRSDVRALMLSALQRDHRPQVARIHRAAIDYYKHLDGVEARAEELYHRLMLEQSERTLDRRWIDAALPSLQASIEELPPRGQAYLWSRSSGSVRIDPDVEVIAQDQTWARAARIDAAKEIRAGRPDVALDIAERRRGRHGESLIPEAEVQALEDLRRFDEALAILDGARRAALRQRRTEAAVSLTLDTIRILERLQRFDDAIAEAERLRDSLRSGRGESALDYLVVSTAYLRLLRRSGCEDTARYEQAAAEIARLAEATPYRDLGSRPGLLREILAEVGTRTTRLLQFGVGQVGVNRGASARLDEQLDRIEDATVGTEPSGPSGPTGPTGSAATPPGPDSSSVQVDLGDLENRASTGRKVSKWAQTVGLDKDFAGALKETFQAETDERYS